MSAPRCQTCGSVMITNPCWQCTRTPLTPGDCACYCGCRQPLDPHETHTCDDCAIGEHQ